MMCNIYWFKHWSKYIVIYNILSETSYIINDIMELYF